MIELRVTRLALQQQGLDLHALHTPSDTHARVAHQGNPREVVTAGRARQQQHLTAHTTRPENVQRVACKLEHEQRCSEQHVQG